MRTLSSRSSSSQKRKVIIIVSIILATAVIGSIGTYAYLTHKQKEAEKAQIDSSTVKEEQVPSPNKEQSKGMLPQKTASDSVQPTSPTAPSDTPATQPEKPTIERAGGDPTIKVVATFQKVSSGNCELRLNKASQTLTYTSSITVGASYYICSFSIPRSSLPDPTAWSMTVIHHIGNASTASDTRNLE